MPASDNTFFSRADEFLKGEGVILGEPVRACEHRYSPLDLDEDLSLECQPPVIADVR